jgi:glutathionylspermidine amidase/synthetase
MNSHFLTGQSTISGNGTNAPFGTITGYASTNVPAYSNGNESYISNDYYYLYGVYTGMKWQCVEYARRWLFLRKGCVFDSVDGAADMWAQLNTVQRVIDQQCFSLKQYPNGSPDPPKNESLIIYSRSGVDMPFGHVAVIVDVLPGFIRVAEENYNAYYWSGNYSRQIPYVFKNGGYFIEDDYPLFGWMSIDDNNQTQALDQTTINGIIQLNGSSPVFPCYNNSGIDHYFSSFYYFLFVFFYIFIM